MKLITKKDVLKMTGTIVAGVLSNPACGYLLGDQYQQQELIRNTFQNVINAFSTIGVPMEEDNDCNLDKDKTQDV